MIHWIRSSLKICGNSIIVLGEGENKKQNAAASHPEAASINSVVREELTESGSRRAGLKKGVKESKQVEKGRLETRSVLLTAWI